MEEKKAGVTSHHGIYTDRRTKIVCTIGPASQSEETLRQIIRAGMDVARFNFSHASYAETTIGIALLRRLAQEEGRVIAILLDLQGPRLRTGRLVDNQVTLTSGAEFCLTTRNVLGNHIEVSIDYPGLTKDIKVGDRILIDDGLLELKAEATTPTDIRCRVLRGGVLKPGRGINVPETPLSIPGVTDKDRSDIAYGVEHKVDYFALSFVRQPKDIVELKELLASHGVHTPVIAKIENQEAVDNFESILAATDGVMVARGDLGIEMPREEVPLLQKIIIKKTRTAGKPVITATQMLDSMAQSPLPTRAEASDVANAIFDGTDALMLSGETSIGAYPVEAVQTMARIAMATEKALPYQEHVARAGTEVAQTVTDAISQAACEVAHELGAKAILASTLSGHTARMIAKYRPMTPVVAITTRPSTQAELTLVWGVLPLLGNSYDNIDQMITSCVKLVKDQGLIAPEDTVVVTSGVPLGTPGRTNMLEVHVADQAG